MIYICTFSLQKKITLKQKFLLSKVTIIDILVIKNKYHFIFQNADIYIYKANVSEEWVRLKSFICQDKHVLKECLYDKTEKLFIFYGFSSNIFISKYKKIDLSYKVVKYHQIEVMFLDIVKKLGVIISIDQINKIIIWDIKSLQKY